VSDSGIGMTPAQRQRIFGAYAQADASVTRRYGGTGLGLAITQRLVEVMRGEIRVSSEPCAGSIFTVDLPLAMVAEAPTSAVPDQRPLRFDGRRILVVEDNPVNQLITRELLERRGARVEVADNGRIALDLVAAGEFDLVLMDVMMPEMDGLEATRRLRATPGCAALPIIGLTANVDRGDLDACLAAGMNAHVGKPIAPDELFARLVDWLPPSPSTPLSSAG
jgi:CheY-like chemotaxis protein